MNFKGQASLELLFVVVVVLSLIVIVFASIPKDTSEIVILGIVKNNVDGFILKTNYTGTFGLDANIIDQNVNVAIIFSNSNYDGYELQKYVDKIENDIKTNANFENIYISYN
jgi:hypothetical protein